MAVNVSDMGDGGAPKLLSGPPALDVSGAFPRAFRLGEPDEDTLLLPSLASERLPLIAIRFRLRDVVSLPYLRGGGLVWFGWGRRVASHPPHPTGRRFGSTRRPCTHPKLKSFR